MLLAEINNAVDDEPLIISPSTVDAMCCHTTRLKLHRFDLSVFVANLLVGYNII